MASLLELENITIDAVDLKTETDKLKALVKKPLTEELINQLNVWRRINTQRQKVIENIKRQIVQSKLSGQNPVQKARAACTDVDTKEISSELQRLKLLRCSLRVVGGTEMMNKRIRDLEEDIEDVGERLIKIIPNKIVQEDIDADETILADRTQLEETQMLKPKMASTVQKTNKHLILPDDEPMMSPITAPKLRIPSTESGECTLSDSDDEIAFAPSKLRLQKKVPGLVKSISESAIGTPKQTSRLRPSGKRTANVLTPRGNEQKKQRSKENPQDEKKRGRPPKTRIATAGSRATSSTRSSSRSPRGFAKTKSMFDLKSNLFQESQSKSTMFDTPKKQSIAEKRAEMKEKERVAQERQRQKKEEIEAERKRKQQEKEEKRLKVKARQEQKDRELEEKRLKAEEKRAAAKKNGKLGKLKKQRELAEEKARQEEKSNLPRPSFPQKPNDSMCINKQRVRELEEAQKAARLQEEERIRAHQQQAQKKLPSPVVYNPEETVIITKKPLQDTAQVTPMKMNSPVNRQSYDITPRGADKPNKSTAENYNIDDLSSGDETDDDERPNKPVPAWAQRQQLLMTTKNQYREHHDFSNMFDGCYAYQERLVDLGDVFGNMVKPSRRRGLQHRETAMWQPMVKPDAPVDRTLNLDVSCFPGEEPRPF